MPARYRIYQDEAFVYSEAYGDLRGEELLAHAKALAVDPAFSPSYAQLADFRAVVRFGPSPAEIRAHAAANPFNSHAKRVALVVTPLAFGTLRMYQLLTNTEDTVGLVTAIEAEAWAHVAREPSVLSQLAQSVWESTPI